MRQLLLGLFLLVAGSVYSEQEHKYYKEGQYGEYYEYDIEGSPKRQKIYKHKHRLTKCVKKPAKGAYKGSRYAYHGVKKMRSMLENYLKGSAKNKAEQERLSHALTSWETALSSNKEDRSKKSRQGIFYAPSEGWRLLKYSLYFVGFAVPRHIKNGMKDIVINTLAIKE